MPTVGVTEQDIVDLGQQECSTFVVEYCIDGEEELPLSTSCEYIYLEGAIGFINENKQNWSAWFLTKLVHLGMSHDIQELHKEVKQ